MSKIAIFLCRWRLFSQGNLRLEFQEVIVFCFVPYFWLFLCIFDYQRLSVTWRGELCLHSQPLIGSDTALLNWLDSFHLTADCVILLLKRNFCKEAFLNLRRYLILLTLEGQITGKNRWKHDLKQILRIFVTGLSLKMDPQFIK